MPDFEAEFEAELLQQQQKPINAVSETTASVLPSITIDRYSVGDFFRENVWYYLLTTVWSVNDGVNKPKRFSASKCDVGNWISSKS